MDKKFIAGDTIDIWHGLYVTLFRSRAAASRHASSSDTRDTHSRGASHLSAVRPADTNQIQFSFSPCHHDTGSSFHLHDSLFSVTFHNKSIFSSPEIISSLALIIMEMKPFYSHSVLFPICWQLGTRISDIWWSFVVSCLQDNEFWPTQWLQTSMLIQRGSLRVFALNPCLSGVSNEHCSPLGIWSLTYLHRCGSVFVHVVSIWRSCDWSAPWKAVFLGQIGTPGRSRSCRRFSRWTVTESKFPLLLMYSSDWLRVP